MPSSDYVLIRFSEPVVGEDPASGEEFTADLHRVDAVHMLQDAQATEFVSEEGEIVAVWPTSLVLNVRWPRSDSGEVGTTVQMSWAEKLVKIRKNHPNAYRPWTPAEEVDLEQRFESGSTLAEISQQHGRGVGGIRSRLKKLGLVDPSMSRAEIDETQRRKREQRPDTKDER